MDRTAHNPGWMEVIFGAALSVALGAVIGALALVFRPVTIVKETPKEPIAGLTYFVEGKRDAGKAKQIMAKRKAFAQGASGTISIFEEELNALVAPATPASKPTKPGEKPAPAASAAPTEAISVGTVNFRIGEGLMKIGVPVSLSALGMELKVFVQVHGTFVKKDAAFSFEPQTIILGSCPLDRLPFAAGAVMKAFSSSQTVAEDIAATWPKLTAVAIDGAALKLTLP